MTRGKRIATALGVAAGILALLALAQGAGVGRSFGLMEDDGSGANAVLSAAAIQREPYKLAAYAEYGEIVARPVFNETRAPEASAEPTADEGANAEATASPLNVSLTGVMIMPDLKLAFVLDNTNNTVQRVRLGNPLEGEQNGWKLVELKPRGAVFEGAGLGRQELELATDTKGAPPTVVAAPVAVVSAAPAQQADPATTPPPAVVDPNARNQVDAASADQIRRRIEERRRQLREEAQRMMQDQQNKQ